MRREGGRVQQSPVGARRGSDVVLQPKTRGAVSPGPESIRRPSRQRRLTRRAGGSFDLVDSRDGQRRPLVVGLKEPEGRFKRIRSPTFG